MEDDMFKTLAFVAALAAAIPATAQDTRAVRYDDLNLASAQGMKILERRIDGAARQVCGASYDYRQTLTLEAATRKCVVAAKARAKSELAARDIGVVLGG
jgi:UrcA family protein